MARGCRFVAVVAVVVVVVAVVIVILVVFVVVIGVAIVVVRVCVLVPVLRVFVPVVALVVVVQSRFWRQGTAIRRVHVIGVMSEDVGEGQHQPTCEVDAGAQQDPQRSAPKP